MASESPCKGGDPITEWGEPLSQLLCVRWAHEHETAVLAVHLPNTERPTWHVMVIASDDPHETGMMAYAGELFNWHVYNP